MYKWSSPIIIIIISSIITEEVLSEIDLCFPVKIITLAAGWRKDCIGQEKK
jgi:hypothetical protein